MNLSQLTAYIGENDNKKGEFGGLIKELNLKKVKDNQQVFVVSMVFDVAKGEIYFEVLDKYQKGIEEQYHYFGNITGAGLQYYVTRDISSIDYLFDEVWKGLKKKLEQHNMKNCSLYKELCIEDKDGNGVLKEVFLSAKTLRDLKGKTENETWIRSNIKEANINDRFLLVVPIIRKSDGEEIILPNHPDYLKLVKVDKGLNDDGLNANDINDINEKENQKVCYICKKRKHGVTISNSANFSRSGINKVFETTTKRTARYQSSGFNYDDTYSFCNTCYQKLLTGEKTITARFTTSIAGERAIVIPEGLFGQFNYNYLFPLKNIVDMAFDQDIKDWIENLESSAEIDQANIYSINFIIYRTDGTSISILLTIEDVPLLHLKKIIQLLSENSISLQPHIKKITLKFIYQIIPVKVNKKGVQLDISRVLTVYKALFRKEELKANSLFIYASEALEKGFNKLSKSNDDNPSYHNIVVGYSIDKIDFFIKRIIMSYLILLRTCQQLRILDKPVFKQNREEVESMAEINSFSEKVNKSINETETFLVKQGFTEPAKALFYLGVLINRVAVAQMLKEHRTKPILRKIQFQGMNIREIERLYHDVVEKLRQYNKMTLFSEAVMNRVHYYFDPLKNNWPLNDQENVFYLMSGYAYMVGNKPVDISPEEAEVQESFNQDNEDENDD